MQGFYVNTSQAGTLTLNYEKLVWNTDLQKNSNVPLRVRGRGTVSDLKGALKVALSSDSLYDYLYMLESDEYAAYYENGYDARKKMSCAFNVFAVADEDYLAVDATDRIGGTRIGVRTGEATMYTFSFSHVNSEDELMLFDIEADETIDIVEGAEYIFFAEPNSMITERFQIIAREKAPGVTTEVENNENSNKVHKFIQNNQLYILKDGVLYNAWGAVVR